VKDRTSSSARSYQGSDKLIFGIVLAVVTFWLFAQTTLNIASTMRADLRISESLNNISVSITALFSGIFIVVAGDLADRIGRMKITYVGLALSILGFTANCYFACRHRSLFNGRTHYSRSLSGVHNATTLALLKAYFNGAARQRAISFWSIGSWGGSGLCSLFGGLVASSIGWRWIFWMSIIVAIGSFLLIRGTPESKEHSRGNEPFDWLGVIAFIIAMVALNVVIGPGGHH
jgi:MFS transporter, DHA2 family, multidrug resistance protein